MRAIFIGHQTWLVEHRSTRILIDPLLCEDFGLVDEHRIDGTCELPPSETFRLATVLAGQGVLIASGEEHVLKRGASFVLPIGSDPVQVTGALMLIVTAPPA